MEPSGNRPQKEYTGMSQVAIKKANDANKRTLPIFGEIAKRFDAVRARAFDLFEKRGYELGHDQEDWLKAERELLGWPEAELAEKDGAYEIKVTLPGFEAKDVEVTTTPTEVIIHASNEEGKKIEKGNVLWTEFGSNDVYRRFELLNPINVDKVTANLENGLLQIKAPETTKFKETKAAA
jgi:HSP20 family molecular chaperone IbpA